jgi:hypothetical protein
MRVFEGDAKYRLEGVQDRVVRPESGLLTRGWYAGQLDGYPPG